MKPTISRQQTTMAGFSLVELMVAMAISLILLFGVTQIYLGTSATNRAQEGLSRVQENARFAIDSLSREIRMAGYDGCPRSKTPDTTVMANHADEDFILSGQDLVGVDDAKAEADSGNSEFWLNGFPDNLVPGQPAIRVTFSSGSDIAAVPGSFGNSAQFNIGSNDVGFRQNDFIVITDCETAHIAEITRNPQDDNGDINISHGQGGGPDGGGNNPHQWGSTGQDYDNGAQAMQFFSYTFYLADNADGSPSLYRREDMRSAGQADVVELVDNVEAMRIQYGEDTNDDLQADTYRAADAVTDWSRVLSVRIAVLLQSREVLSEVPATQFDLLGEVLSRNDRRVRQVATTTISLRNRME